MPNDLWTIEVWKEYDSFKAAKTTMKAFVTNKELADALGVSESSMRRWTNTGVIKTSRTVGGHRRIPIAEAVRFVRDSRLPLARPDLLGLPDLPGPAAQENPGQHLFEALVSGHEAQARSQVVSLYLSGTGVPAICDGPIRYAMHQLGELWRHDERGILTEHRGTDICVRLLAELRQLLPAPGVDAPVAVGGAPDADPYIVPSLMAAMVLADAGFRDMNYSANTPVALLSSAAREHHPALVWLSISAVEDKASLVRDIDALAGELGNLNIPLVIGGRAAGDLTLPTAVHHVQSMAELAAFARGLRTVKLPAP